MLHTSKVGLPDKLKWAIGAAVGTTSDGWEGLFYCGEAGGDGGLERKWDGTTEWR
jgi:hypothetical protein